MKRHDHACRAVGMAEHMVAAAHPIKLPAALSQHPDGLTSRDRGQPRAHTPTVTRSTSTGAGMGSP